MTADAIAPLTPETLKAWRKDWGVSQERLAELLGIHRVSVAHWETGRHPIPAYLHLALRELERQLL